MRPEQGYNRYFSGLLKAPEFYSWGMRYYSLMKNRVLICTFLALLSGLAGGYVGGQINSHFHTQKCHDKNWVEKQMCQVIEMPGAMWQGSISGLWTGTILGAFFGGLVSRQN